MSSTVVLNTFAIFTDSFKEGLYLPFSRFPIVSRRTPTRLKAKAAGHEEQYLSDSKIVNEFTDSFKSLSLEYKLSNINQAKAFAKYMNKIGCFYTDKDVDFEQVERFSDEELIIIGRSEHQRWLQEHYDMGWTYGNPEKSKRDLERKHWDMIPDFSGFEVSDEDAEENYKRLNKAE